MDEKELGFRIKILGTDGQISQLNKTEKAIIKLREQRDHLNRAYKNGEISIDQLARANTSYNAQMKVLNKTKQEALRNIQLENQRVKNQVSTYKNLDATLQLLKRRYKEFSEAERQSASGKALLNKIQQTDAQLKAFDASIGQNQRNVGNYSSALKGATGILGAFGGRLSSYLNQMQMITAAVNKMTVAQDANTAAVGRGSVAMRVFKTAAAPIILVLAAVVGLFVAATKKGAEFSKSLSGLRAILGDLADDKSMEALSEDAQRLGSETEYTAVQVVSLQTELAKLGFTVDEILNSTGGILSLATALDTDLASAAALTGSVLRGFGLDASETGRVVDVMAKGATKSGLDFEGLRESLKLAVPAARAVNMTIEDTVALLGTLADSGIKGSLAGTGLQKVFIELNKKGIALDDAFKMVAGSSNQLNTAIELVGDRGGKSLLILANNVPKIKELNIAMLEAAGAAKEMAQVKLDNLSGDTTILKSAWEGLLLTIEDGNGVLNQFSRFVVQLATKALIWLRDGINGFSERWNTMTGTIRLGSEMVSLFVSGMVDQVVGYFQLLANKTKLAIAGVPILGGGIDKAKAEKGINEARLLLEKANQTLQKSYDKAAEIREFNRNHHERLKESKERQERIKYEKELEEYEKQLSEKQKKEREKRLKEQERQLQDANKSISDSLKSIREAQVELMEDGYDKEVEALDAKIQSERDKLMEGLSSEKQRNAASAELKAKLLEQDRLINQQILLLEEQRMKGLEDIDKKYTKKAEADRKKANDQKLKQLEQHQTLEELAIRNQVINKELTVEEGEKAILEIQKKYLQLQLELIDTTTTEGKVKYQELVNEIDKINNPEGGEKRGLAELLSITDEEAELLKNRAMSLAQEIAASISRIQQIERDNRLRADLDAEQTAKDERLKTLDTQLEKGYISQEQYNSRKSQLDAEYDQKREEIERAAFERNKRASINNAVVAGSLAILNVLATNKGGAIARAIEAGYVVAQTALQVAEIKKQEFAEGGIVLSGQRVSESSRNIPTKRNGDNVLATVKTGEVVLNERQQQALGGDRTFASIGVPGFASGGLISPSAPSISPAAGQGSIKLDDSQLKGLFNHLNNLVDTKIRNLRVSEYEISSTQNTVSTLEQEATF